MQYKLINDLKGIPYSVIKIDDNDKRYGIPFDPANSDYQAYLKWIAQGNTPLPADK